MNRFDMSLSLQMYTYLITRYTPKTCCDTYTLAKEYQLRQHRGCVTLYKYKTYCFFWFVIDTCKLQDNIIM